MTRAARQLESAVTIIIVRFAPSYCHVHWQLLAVSHWRHLRWRKLTGRGGELVAGRGR